MARHAPARGGNGGHRRGRRGARRALRQMEQRPAGPAAGHVARVGVPRSVARLARPRLHRRTRRRHRRDRGDRPGAFGDRRGARRRDEGVVPDRHRRPPPQRPRRPGRGADCVVARPGRRRRPVPAHVRGAERDAARLRRRRSHGRERQPAGGDRRTGGAPRPARAPRRGDRGGSRRPRCRSVRHRADHGLGLERPDRRRRRPADRGQADLRQRGHAAVVRDHGHPAAQRARLRSERSLRRAGRHDRERDVRPQVPRRPAAHRAAHHGRRSSRPQGIRSRRRGLGRDLSLAARGRRADDVPAARGAGIAFSADHADPFDVDRDPIDCRSGCWPRRSAASIPA